jgi:TonB family protein
MHSHRVPSFALALLILSFPLCAQDVLSVDEQTLSQHLDRQAAPVYPPIAKAARIGGAVVFDIHVAKNGKIESMKVVSGPAMLQQAAIDCLKQWTFRPFVKDGAVVAATGRVSINFDLGKDAPTPEEDAIAARYFPADEKCQKALATHDNSSSTGDICRQAADIAGEFAPNVRFIEKRSSFVSAAWALGNCRDFKDALVYANKAVAIVQLGHDDNSGEGSAYGVRGVIEGNLNDLTGADQDLELAEQHSRKAIEWAAKEAPELKGHYKSTLALYLRIHSALLVALNRTDDAKSKLEEIDQLK